MILEHSSLAFNDLPLVFWIQAGLATLIRDVPLSVRLTDAILPALSAIPLYLMTRKSKWIFLPAVAILVVLLNPIQLYFFTGDFIKNAAAIPIVITIAYLLLNWNNRSLKFSIPALIIMFTLLVLSHFGTLLLGLGLVVVWLFLQMRKKSWHFWLIASISTLVVLGIAVIALAVLVPARFDRLISFVTSTEAFLIPAWQMMLQGRSDSVMIFTSLFGQLAAFILALVAWKIRRDMTYTTKSLLGASLILTLVFSSPLIGMEWFDRLTALSFVPLSIAMLIIWDNLTIRWLRLILTALPVLTLIVSLALFQVGAKKPVLYGAQYTDFITLTNEVVIPPNSIVVARHGLEYLIAWEIDTDVVQDSSYLVSDTESYDNVYYLVEKQSSQKPRPGYGGKPNPGSGIPPLENGNGVSKSDSLVGTMVYENTSFSLIKVR